MPRKKGAQKAKNLGNHAVKKVFTLSNLQNQKLNYIQSILKHGIQSDNEDEPTSKRLRHTSESLDFENDTNLNDNQSINTVSTRLTDLSLDEDIPELQNEADLFTFLAQGQETLASLRDKIVCVARMAIKGRGNYCTTKIEKKPAARTIQYHNQKAQEQISRENKENLQLKVKPTKIPDFFKKTQNTTSDKVIGLSEETVSVTELDDPFSIEDIAENILNVFNVMDSEPINEDVQVGHFMTTIQDVHFEDIQHQADGRRWT